LINFPVNIRFTRSKDNKTLFATILGWPGEEVVVKSLNSQSISLNELDSVSMFGGDKVLEWTQVEDGLHLKFPEETDPHSFAYVLKLTFKKQVPSLSKK
jgi:alpha-L-fucosidase